MSNTHSQPLNPSAAAEPASGAPPAAYSEDGAPLAGGASESAQPGMALSVTRHAPITGPREFTCLTAGVDTLDIGLYVDWSSAPGWFFDTLERSKTQASGTSGVYWHLLEGVVHPSGKPPNYRWHIEYPEFHLFPGKSITPAGSTPNVYASINAKTLWLHGVREAVKLVVQRVTEFGGYVDGVRPSRVDLAADFHIPDGLSLDFLRTHKVSNNSKERHECELDNLETFYSGSRQSPVQLRIYDKGKEILAGGQKFWFRDVWKRDSLLDVWRVEFQLRRPFLKQCGANSIEELLERLPWMWRHLATDWFSLRERDNQQNITRCPIHPWWETVQQASERFGELKQFERITSDAQPSVQWYISHVAGCLLSYAARKQIPELPDAWDALGREVADHWANKPWAQKYLVSLIKLGLDPSQVAST